MASSERLYALLKTKELEPIGMKTYSPTRWSEMRAKEEETGAAVKVCSCKKFSLPTIDKSFREKNKKELSTSLKLIIYWSRKFCLKTLKSITRLAIFLI